MVGVLRDYCHRFVEHLRWQERRDQIRSKVDAPNGCRHCIFAGDKTDCQEAHTSYEQVQSVCRWRSESTEGGGFEVALIWEDGHHAFEVESVRSQRLNMISHLIHTRRTSIYAVGCYIAPTDTGTVCRVKVALADCLKGFKPMLLGDLNACLWAPINQRTDTIAGLVDKRALVQLTRNFVPCGSKQRRKGRRWS